MSDQPEAAEAPAAGAEKNAKQSGKDSKKSGKQSGKKSGKKRDAKQSGRKGAAGGGGLSVAGHPRAAAAVRRAKGFGGIAGFALAALLAHNAGLSISHTLERALLAGVAGYLLAWGCAVTVWRQILVAQLRAALARRESARPARRTLPVTGADPAPAGPPAAPES